MGGRNALLGRIVNTKVIGEVLGLVSVQNIALSTGQAAGLRSSEPGFMSLKVRRPLSDICLVVLDVCCLGGTRCAAIALGRLTICAFLGRRVFLCERVALGRGRVVWSGLRCRGQTIGLSFMVDTTLF